MISSLAEWTAVRRRLDETGHPIGFVPTMGALHAGHASLFRRSAAECELTVASVFVNPSQFNDPADLAAYPRTLDADRELAEAAGVDYLIAPAPAEVYPDGYRYRVTETEMSRTLEGEFRPGHFDGVLTVVLRLLTLVRPDRAYFGEKDWQQYSLVRGMAEAFHLGIEIVPCPIVRDPDGVALSSRNVRLSPTARALAARFAARLAAGGPVADIRHELEALGIEVEYVREADGRRLAAVVIGGVRLIDNQPLTGP
ncbi:MAG: pantoate--beta-alanine ligase [Gemmatimonadales bacterium]